MFYPYPIKNASRRAVRPIILLRIEGPKIFTFDIFGASLPITYAVDYDDRKLLWRTTNIGTTWVKFHKLHAEGDIVDITNWNGKKLGLKETSGGGTEIVFFDKNI